MNFQIQSNNFKILLQIVILDQFKYFKEKKAPGIKQQQQIKKYIFTTCSEFF